MYENSGGATGSLPPVADAHDVIDYQLQSIVPVLGLEIDGEKAETNQYSIHF